jgi:hypothetical protein
MRKPGPIEFTKLGLFEFREVEIESREEEMEN